MTRNAERSERRNHRVPEILAAVLAVFWAAASLHAAGVTMKDSASTVEITGGSGASAWRLRYGTHMVFRVPHDLVVTGDQAYFSHGNWLRQIDTRRGMVTRRWHFPWQISKIVPEGGNVRVEIAWTENLAHSFRETVLLNLQAPQIPNWPDMSQIGRAHV